MISVLNKHWRPLSKREYWHKMDWNETMEALKTARIDESDFDRIFKPLQAPGVIVRRRK